MAKMLARIEQILRGEAPPPPVADLIGFKLVSVKPGEAVIELEATKAHANPMGTLHGGILCDIADTAMGMALLSKLEEDESLTTLELKIKFLKAIWNARLLATGQVVKQGRTVGLVQCDVTDANGSLMARATTTGVLRGTQAHGR
jgi:uncharacterized protein (TIGR00369 family)